MTKQERQLADATESLSAVTTIVARINESGLTRGDLASVRAAANQARQAAQALDVLSGMLDANG